MKSFQGKVVVVTGAGSGIGKATALAFAGEGARLHLVDIDRQRVEEVTRELTAQGHSAIAHGVDCTNAEAVRQLAESVFSAEGRVDILHNNAGVCHGGPVEEATLDDWRWIVNVNLWGVIHGIWAFLPKMIAQGGGGHIINTASMAGLYGIPFVVPYCATKFAVVGLSEALASELAPHGIHVTLVCPGMVKTNVMRDGRFALPGTWQRRIGQLFDRLAVPPEAMAAQILEAVRRKRFLLVSGKLMVPAWLLKRASNRLFVGAWSLALERLARQRPRGSV